MIVYNPAERTWRYQINPLRALTIVRTVNLLEQAERGYHADIQWFYTFIERRDPTLKACIERRQSALEKLDWTIKVGKDYQTKVNGETKIDAMAEAQRKALEEVYNGIDNLKEAISFLGLAEFRGFAHLEKHYRNDLRDEGVFHLEPVPQYHWCKREPSNAWLFNPTGKSTNLGEPIEESDYIIREWTRPINEIAAIAFNRKGLAQKDWDGFLETFGRPPIFLELPEGMSREDRTEAQSIAEQIIGDSRGTIPFGAKIHTLAEGGRGVNPFKEFKTDQNEDIVMAATSGKLTVLNDSTGLGSGQSKVHADTFQDLASAEASRISEIFQQQIDRAELAIRFPNQEPMVYFCIEPHQQTDIEKYIGDVAVQESAGFENDVAEVSERTGMKLTRRAEEPMPTDAGSEFFQGGRIPNSGRMLSNRETLQERARRSAIPPKVWEQRQIQAFAEAERRDLNHLRNRVQNILAVDNVEVRNQKLKELLADLPGLLKDFTRDPESARVLESSLTAAFQGVQTE